MASLGIFEFVQSMRNTGGIPREEKWKDIKVRSLKENLDRVLPEIVKKEMDYILENLDVPPENFLIIGGTAVIACVPYRVTTDIDILTYDKSILARFLEIYEKYRDPVLNEVSVHYFRGKHTDKVHLIMVSPSTYDITWFPKAKLVKWSDKHRFYIPHIDRIIEMKELSDRAVDKEDATALKYWRKTWETSRDIPKN